LLGLLLGKFEVFMDTFIVGRNAVREALKSDRGIHRILVAEGKQGGSLSEILGLAKSKGVEIRRVKERELQKYPSDVPNQGVVALVNAVKFQEMQDVLLQCTEEHPLLILTDGVEDPHNMGAIIRTAECVGATAVLIPKRHNAPINATVSKTSAGAVESIPLVQIGNVAQTIEQLKSQGFWVMGAHMDGTVMYDVNMTGPIVLVIGNEGKGLSRLTKELCDVLVTIPMFGTINSLNASVAAAILLYEARRQR